MNPEFEVSERREWGRRYAEALNRVQDHSWWELKDQFDQGSLGPIEALVLVHPDWFLGNGRDDCLVRGASKFAGGAESGSPCQSEVIWNYQCPLVGSKPHRDHLFPWALGGPTTPTNIIWLCPTHNLAKGPDWHVVVAPIQSFRWFPETLDKVETLISRLSPR